MIPDDWFGSAEQRVANYIIETPLTWDASRGLFLKWENRQVTGSFKARGALNKVLSLSEWERRKGLVAASAGNHGQGVALAARQVGAEVEVLVPRHTGPAKIEAMRRLGARVRLISGGYADAEQAARHDAQESGRTFISPYNDGQVIAGQGTLAAECLRQLRHSPSRPGRIACWVMPTGGGGLLSGCGAVLSKLEQRPRVLGVQAAASPFAYSLFHYHTQNGVKDDPTLAEGLSGAIEETSLTIPMLERYADDLLLVSEDEIRRAIAFAWYVYGERLEGSAAAALAAALENRVKARPALIVITGGNIESEVHRQICAQYESEKWN